MVRNRSLVYGLLCTALLVLGLVAVVSAQGPTLSIKEQLGKSLFFDKNLSNPPGQACAACHGPEVGYTGPGEAFNKAGAVYEGATKGRFGNRKPPAAAYDYSPVMSDTPEYMGGVFWDGRATGHKLGDPLAEQAQGPFLNPLEQNVASARDICTKVKAASYVALWNDVWGPNTLSCTGNYTHTYELVARSIAEYERSKEVSAFTSKYDAYLNGQTSLNQQEALGLSLFEGKAACNKCHISRPDAKGAPVFTDYTYNNLGIPKNPANPFYTAPAAVNPDGAKWIDPGLGGYLKGAGAKAVVYQEEWGKFKVPTLRNVDKRPTPNFVKAYGHNGYFKSLKDIVHYYNTRDVVNAGWPAPEYPDTLNKTELGNLGLTPTEEAAIVAFLGTLSDGWKP
jgi:cytochrome c peroxidase